MTRHRSWASSLRCFLKITFVLGCLAIRAEAQQWNTSGNNIYNGNSGKVGIGTTNPLDKLHVAGGDVRIDQTLFVRSLVGIQSSAGNLDMMPNTSSGWIRFLSAGYANVVGGIDNYGNLEMLGRLRILGTDPSFLMGNVGIGTNNPQSRLDVAGDVIVSGNISAKYQDVAEWVPTSQSLSSGSVVVLSPGHGDSVIRSTTPYDTRVAGVVSSNPGIVLGEGGEGKVRVATTGRVKVRVDASVAPIEVGDLLVTGSKEGTAMKSQPVNLSGIEIHRPGTLIGKALEPLSEGEGEILVLLSLQ